MPESFFVAKYSDALVAEITAYFKEKGGLQITRETAEAYLDELAGLYECLERSAKEELEASSPSRKGFETAQRSGVVSEGSPAR